jgi:hypothetical protein
MTEFLTWGLPIFAALALVALSYNALQVASRVEDYWMAMLWFGLGVLIVVVRTIYWGVTSNRNLTLRIVVCFIVCGSIGAVTVLAFRSINHKRERWVESDQKSVEKAPLVEEKQWYETPEYDLTAKEAQVIAIPPPKQQLPEKVRPPRKSLQERAELLHPTPLPKITCKGTRIIKRYFDLDANTLIDEEYFGDDDDLALTIKPVSVALAKFYYHPDVGVDPYIRVKAHIEFRDPYGEVSQNVDDAVWFKHEDEYIEFYTAKSHELIVALIPEDGEGIISFEYGLKSYEDYVGKFFSPELERVEGKEFRANVQLICNRGTEFRSSIPFSFELKLDPEVKFEEFKPSESKTSESQAKREYVIEQLKNLIEEGREFTRAHWIDDMRMEMWRKQEWEERVARFLTQYGYESYIPTFNSKGTIALEELLKEVLG